MKKIILAIAVLALAVGIAGAAEKTPLRIAFIDPLSGPMASGAAPFLDQLQFDAKRLNKEGGINGHPIVVTGFDNKVSPQESLVQLQKAMDQGYNYIVQGAGSSVASALLNAIDKHNRRNPDSPVVFLNWAAVDPAFTNERCSFWHFRFDENADQKMNVMTDWIVEQDDIHKVFLINMDYSFGHAVSEAAREMLHEKDPSVEVVGDVFHPLGKVKDFSPYISQIKASNADVVVTGNWGQDIILLVKAAADYGLETPFLTYYGATPGTVTQLEDKGVDRLAIVAEFSSEYENDPDLIAREKEMYEAIGYDYGAIRVTTLIEMLKKAAHEANSIDPAQVAFALEGMKYDTPWGEVTMRKDNHQILMPMYVSMLKDNMEYGVEGTDFGFHALQKFSAQDTALPTTCKMRRPEI